MNRVRCHGTGRRAARLGLVCALAAAGFDASSAQEAQGVVSVPVEMVTYPDLIVFNGKIATMDDRSTTATPGTMVQAMAVRGEKILVLGTGEAIRGKLADFLVLNKDFFTVPDADVPSVFPLMTVVGGKIIVLREELAKEIGSKPAGPQIQFTDRPVKGDSEGEG